MFSKSVVSLDWGNCNTVISSRPFNILSIELMPQTPQTQCLYTVIPHSVPEERPGSVLIFRCFLLKAKSKKQCFVTHVRCWDFPSLFCSLKILGKMYWLAGWTVKQIALEMYFFFWLCLAASATWRVGISSLFPLGGNQEQKKKKKGGVWFSIVAEQILKIKSCSYLITL